MKYAKILVLLAIAVILIVPIVYAGWFTDWITGHATTRPTNLSVSVGNTDPVVSYVSNPGAQTVIENGTRTVDFEVHVYDADGADNIDDAETEINITIMGGGTGQVETDTACVDQTDIDANTENYTCSVTIWYWYESGYWNITARAQDISSAVAQNFSQSFQLQDTTALKIYPNTVSFPGTTPGQSDIQGSDDPTVINNTANHNVTVDGVQMTAIHLYGASNQNYKINAENFTVDETDACDAGPRMSNGSAVAITGSILGPGNLSEGGGVAQEQLYYCIEEVDSGLSQQTYNTENGGSWTISVV